MPRKHSSVDRTLDQAVGRHVRFKRRLLHLSQQSVAVQLGITYQQLQKCETGRNAISASRPSRLSQILGEPVENIFDGLEPDAKTEGPADRVRSLLSEESITSQGIKLLRAFARIQSPKLRRHVVGLVDDLANQSSECA